MSTFVEQYQNTLLEIERFARTDEVITFGVPEVNDNVVEKELFEFPHPFRYLADRIMDIIYSW